MEWAPYGRVRCDLQDPGPHGKGIGATNAEGSLSGKGLYIPESAAFEATAATRTTSRAIYL